MVWEHPESTGTLMDWLLIGPQVQSGSRYSWHSLLFFRSSDCQTLSTCQPAWFCPSRLPKEWRTRRHGLDHSPASMVSIRHCLASQILENCWFRKLEWGNRKFRKVKNIWFKCDFLKCESEQIRKVSLQVVLASFNKRRQFRQPYAYAYEKKISRF